MAFGAWMAIEEGDVRLRLGPIRREDARSFVAREAQLGMQSYEVMRFLGGGLVPTEQGEEEWWDKAAKDDDRVHWGIYLPGGDDDDEWKLVGNTTLTFRRDRRQAESGFVLFD